MVTNTIKKQFTSSVKTKYDLKTLGFFFFFLEKLDISYTGLISLSASGVKPNLYAAYVLN